MVSARILRISAWWSILVAGCGSTEPPTTEDDTATGSTSTSSGTASTGTTTPSMSTSGTDPSGDPDASSGEPQTGSTTTSGVGECDEGWVCSGARPEGFKGPVIVAKGDVEVVEGEEMPNCPFVDDPFPGNNVERFEGFAEPEAHSCECSCGISCSFMYYYEGTSAACFNYYTDATEGCNTTPNLDGVADPSLYVGSSGSCAPQFDETIPAIPWEARSRTCAASYTYEPCDDAGRVCHQRPPEGFEQEICYVAEGDVPCPDTEYTNRTLRHTSVDDTRECTACVCGSFSGNCANSYNYYTSDDCTGAPAGAVSNYTCTTVAAGVASLAFDFDASCNVTQDSQPVGEAMPTDPWTYCCAPL